MKGNRLWGKFLIVLDFLRYGCYLGLLYGFGLVFMIAILAWGMALAGLNPFR